MNVRAEANIVSEIIADVVRIVINDDLVIVPVPTAAEANVKGGHAPEEAIEAEAVWSAAAQVPNVAAANAAVEMAVFPGMIQMIVRVVAPSLVAYPFPVTMDVGSFRMAFSIRPMLFLRSGPGILMGRRTMRRFKAAPNAISTVLASTAVLFMFMLRAQERGGCHR